MKVYPNNQKRYDYIKWESKKNQPYDYQRNGFLQHVMSHRIVETQNEALKHLLNYIEKTFIMLMKFTQRMQNFKNYAYTNR
jgi:hypothetical protein